jgi:hypothetical protein
MAVKNFEFEEISDEQKKLLLSAFGYSVDQEGYIIDSLLARKVISQETRQPFTLKNTTFVQGSLRLIDSDPLVVSRYLREEVDNARFN